MSFTDTLSRHAEQVRNRLPHIKGEEATKQALIIPLLQLLGYDVFDPREVKPEYTADFAVKRAGQLEKIDYAICNDGVPVLFVECKAHDQPLEDHAGQLARYFNATPSVRIAVIVNGVRMRVYTDLQQPNVMDRNPWLEIDLLNPKPVEVDALHRLRKSEYAAEAVVALAEEMVYYSAMVGYIAQQFREPSEGFVRHVAGEVLPSTRMTKGLVERLSPTLKKAIQTAILENVAKSFTAQAADPAPTVTESESQPLDQSEVATGGDGIETTAEELWCFEQILSWIRDVHPDAAVAYRDSKSHFTIHQNNVRKWFVRLGVQKPPFWVSFRHVHPEDLKLLAPGLQAVSPGSAGDSRVLINSVRDLPILRSAIIASYDREAAPASGDGASSDSESA